MQITRLVLTEDEQRLLASLLGSEWVHLSGDTLVQSEFAWESIRVQTTDSAVEIALEREVVEVAADVDEYPALHIRPAGPVSATAERSGRIYFQNRGERVCAIWVIRDTVAGIRTEYPDFTYVADVAVAFELDTHWVAIERDSFFSDALLVTRSNARDDLSLPDTWDEWESDLLDQYTVTREWIPIA